MTEPGEEDVRRRERWAAWHAPEGPTELAVSAVGAFVWEDPGGFGEGPFKFLRAESKGPKCKWLEIRSNVFRP